MNSISREAIADSKGQTALRDRHCVGIHLVGMRDTHFQNRVELEDRPVVARLVLGGRVYGWRKGAPPLLLQPFSGYEPPYLGHPFHAALRMLCLSAPSPVSRDYNE